MSDTTIDAAVTPAPTATWLRSPLRPFLDMAVSVTDFSTITTPARAGVFEVLGRSNPIAVTEVRGSRRYELTITTADVAGAAALEDFLAFGDVVLIQPPSSACPIPGPLYASVGDVTERRPGRHDGARRYFVLPLTECSGPDPLVVGSTITWNGVVSAFATWNAVIAAKATWNALCSTVSAPTDEVIS